MHFGLHAIAGTGDRIALQQRRINLPLLRAEHVEVMIQPVGRIVEHPAEVARRVVVDEADRDLGDAQLVVRDLRPQLHGKRIAGDVELKLAGGGHAVGLEAAEGVRQAQSLRGVHVVEDVRNSEVDGATVGGWQIVAFHRVQVARAADHVPAVGLDRADEVGNALGFVLFVAVHGQDPVVAARVRPGEGVDQALAVAAVFRVADQVNIGP